MVGVGLSSTTSYGFQSVGNQQASLNLRARRYEDVRVFGIARDGIESVRLALRNGQEVSATVRGNTFLLLGLPDRPASVSWEDASGRQTVQAPGRPAEVLAEAVAGP